MTTLLKTAKKRTNQLPPYTNADEAANRQTPIGLATMSAALPEAQRYHEWVYRSFRQHLRGRILEVGTGYGIYTQRLLRHGNVVASDIDPECLLPIRHQVSAAKLHCMKLDLNRDADFELLQQNPCDTVVCLNVLEHIKDDAGAVRRMASALRRGGRMVVFVPAMTALFGTLDDLAGHYRRYTRKGLIRLLQDAGLVIVQSRYQNSVGAIGWWWNGRVRKEVDLSSNAMSQQIRFYDRWIVPTARVVDLLTRRLFGQSVLVVAEK